MREAIKETLEKQLQLLSERSRDELTPNGLALLTDAMCSLSNLLLSEFRLSNQ